VRRGVRLGVDPGTVRVGLASSDPDGLLASPLDTLRRDSRSGQDVEEIARIVRSLGVLEVVVGLPTTLSGRAGPAAGAAHAYAVLIARRVEPVPVRVVDERFSTVEAGARLREAGLEGRRRRLAVDRSAAAVILQSALDAERASGGPPGSLVVPDPHPDGPDAGNDDREAGPR
jgi:putative pre-16S rRNA nuclease